MSYKNDAYMAGKKRGGTDQGREEKEYWSRGVGVKRREL